MQNNLSFSVVLMLVFLLPYGFHHSVELREEDRSYKLNFRAIQLSYFHPEENASSAGAKCWPRKSPWFCRPHSPRAVPQVERATLLKQASRRVKRLPISQGCRKPDRHRQQLPPRVWELLPFTPQRAGSVACTYSSSRRAETFPYSQAPHDRRSPINFLSPTRTFPQLAPDVTFSLLRVILPRNTCSTA